VVNETCNDGTDGYTDFGRIYLYGSWGGDISDTII